MFSVRCFLLSSSATMIVKCQHEIVCPVVLSSVICLVIYQNIFYYLSYRKYWVGWLRKNRNNCALHPYFFTGAITEDKFKHYYMITTPLKYLHTSTMFTGFFPGSRFTKMNNWMSIHGFEGDGHSVKNVLDTFAL